MILFCERACPSPEPAAKQAWPERNVEIISAVLAFAASKVMGLC